MNFTRRNAFIPFLAIFFFATALTGCLGPKKINKWVAKEYQELPPPPKKTSEYLTVVPTTHPADDAMSTTETTTSRMLPLLFYWHFDYKYSCTLNPRIPIGNFTSTVLSYSGKKLREKLNGQHVELTIEKMPGIFSIADKGYMVWLILVHFGTEHITIEPQDKEMLISYRILNADNTETKKGEIDIPSADRGIELRMFQSLKKMTWEYLDTYNANITAMSKRVIDQLISEL